MPKQPKNSLLQTAGACSATMVMYNDFVIVGPANDPAKLSGLRDAPAALKKLAETQAIFVSRGDDSGTHKKEQALWKAADIDPTTASGSWYRETGSGMGATFKHGCWYDGVYAGRSRHLDQLPEQGRLSGLSRKRPSAVQPVRGYSRQPSQTSARESRPGTTVHWTGCLVHTAKRALLITVSGISSSFFQMPLGISKNPEKGEMHEGKIDVYTELLQTPGPSSCWGGFGLPVNWYECGPRDSDRPQMVAV